MFVITFFAVNHAGCCVLACICGRANVIVHGTHLIEQAVVVLLFVHLQCYRSSGKSTLGER